MSEEGLLINSKHRFEIATDGTEDDFQYARLAKGFSNFDPGTNEETDQTGYLDQEGWLETTVMAGQLTLTFTGHRYFGDDAQDFIFGKQFGLGKEREVPSFKWTMPDNTVIEGPATIAELTGPGGDAIAKGDITVAIHLKGKPNITTANGAQAASTQTTTEE